MMERERWHRRVAEGKIKTLSQMNDRDRRHARKKRKEVNQRCYANRKKKEVADSASTLQFNSTPTTSRKSTGRRQVKANRSAVQRKLVKKVQENGELRRNCRMPRRSYQSPQEAR